MFSRFTFIRSFKIAISLSIAYLLTVSTTAVAIYKYDKSNSWTSAIEEIFPYPSAIVNGEVISLNRFRKEVAARNSLAQKNNIPASRLEIEKSVSNRLITRAIYSQTLRTNGIIISDADIESSLQSVYDQIGGKENLSKFLKDEYSEQITLTDFRLLTKEFLEQSALENKLLMHAKVRHILIAVPENASGDQVSEARNRAVAVKEKLTDISKFSEVTKEFSEDLATREKGGELGTSTRGQISTQFSPEFEDAVFTLPVGKLSDPIRSRHGWHLLMIDNRDGKIDKSLERFTADERAKSKIAVFIGK